MIDNKPRELTLIYHPAKNNDKKARAFVESLNNFVVKTLDLSKDKVTATQLVKVASKMQIDVLGLIDKTYVGEVPHGKEYDLIAEMEDTDILTLLVGQPLLLCTPIIIVGDRAYRYGTAYDFVRKGLEVEGPKERMANADEKNGSQ